MKAIICALEKQQKELYDLVGKRYVEFREHSEEWRNSEDGQKYRNKTMDLENICESISLGLLGLKEK